MVSRGDNTGAKVSAPHKMTASAHTRRTVARSLGLATTVELSPHPPLRLWPPPLASVTVPLTIPAETQKRACQAPSATATDKPTRRYSTSRASTASTAGGKHIYFTICALYRLVQHPVPTRLDRCLACRVSDQHVVLYIRSTQRHSHSCFCKEPTGSLAAGYEVSRRSPATGAGASSSAPLSQGTGACALSAARPRTGARARGATNLSYGIIKATGACASGAAPPSFGMGAYAPRAAPPSHARLHVLAFSKIVLLLHLPAMRWRSV